MVGSWEITVISFLVPCLFSGAMLVLGRVPGTVEKTEICPNSKQTLGKAGFLNINVMMNSFFFNVSF